MRDVTAIGRGIPAGVTVWHEVDLDLPDPAAVDEETRAKPGQRRRCIATTKAVSRCSAPAIGDLLVCAAHAGRLDARLGGRAKAAKLRLVRNEAMNRMVEQELGTRAVIAAELRAQADNIRRTIRDLSEAAAQGDRGAQKLLPAYLNQGFGQPTLSVTSSDSETLFPMAALTTQELRERLNQAKQAG
jgi:hypothetical protein